VGLEALAVNGHKFQYLQVVWLDNNQITDVGLEVLAVNGNNTLELLGRHKKRK
jgi:hypothetical protein